MDGVTCPLRACSGDIPQPLPAIDDKRGGGGARCNRRAPMVIVPARAAVAGRSQKVGAAFMWIFFPNRGDKQR